MLFWLLQAHACVEKPQSVARQLQLQTHCTLSSDSPLWMLQAHARTEELWSTARQLQQEASRRGRAADAASAVAERDAQAAISMQRLQEAKQETAAASKAVRLASEQLYVAAEARLHSLVRCDDVLNTAQTLPCEIFMSFCMSVLTLPFRQLCASLSLPAS